MATFNIPLATLTVGSRDFGPASVANTDSLATLLIDRTVTNGGVNGMNAQPTSTSITFTVSQSNDGGTTWQQLMSAVTIGGSTINPHTGSPYTASTINIGFNPGTSRQAKATVTVAGASVAVAGSLTTQ